MGPVGCPTAHRVLMQSDWLCPDAQTPAVGENPDPQFTGGPFWDTPQLTNRKMVINDADRYMTGLALSEGLDKLIFA